MGTRRSPLARAQTLLVLSLLARVAPGMRFESVPIDTSGDRDRSRGSSPDFTDTIDRALLGGTVDLAVHSAKDLPVELDDGFELLACPRRADPRDCLVVAREHSGTGLPRGARVGSSSPRRRAQLLRWRADLNVVEVRGNIDTRMGLIGSGAVDAVILAVAGISRLRRTDEIGRILSSAAFLPAPAQGALAVVGRTGDSPVASIVRRIDHWRTHVCVTAERAFAAALGGDCRMPLGALATANARTVSLRGEVLSADGRKSLRGRRSGPIASAATLGARLGTKMLDGGAQGLLLLSPR